MSQFAVDPSTGELVRENGSFVRIDGLAEVAQHVRVRVRLIRGEVPTDLSKGMRWFGLILAKGTPAETVEQEFTDTILGTPGVTSVDEITLLTDRATRAASLRFEASVSLGDAQTRIPLHDTFTLPLGNAHE
jgi:hypothetical protein